MTAKPTRSLVSRLNGRAMAWVGLFMVIVSYSALLGWRAICWSALPDYPTINGYCIQSLFAYLFYEANEPTLVVAATASLCARLTFDGEVAALLAIFAGRHPDRTPEYHMLGAAFEKHTGRRGCFWIILLSCAVGTVAVIFHWKYPDVGLHDWDSVSVRPLCAVCLMWVLWWSVSAVRHVFRPLMRGISEEIQPLHPDHAGGVGEFGACMLRVGSPLFATALLLGSWVVLPVISQDYSPQFGAVILMLLVLCGLPTLIYAWRPLWQLHVLLEGAKARALEDLSPPALNSTEARAAFNSNRETIAYLNGMSTWPLGSLSPMILLILSQLAALLSKVAVDLTGLKN